MVESGNIFNEYVQSFPFNLPTDISVGLLPGDAYFWKVLFLDGNENIVGNIDDLMMGHHPDDIDPVFITFQFV